MKRKYDPFKIELDCGETISLRELVIDETEAGFLEGHPLAIDQSTRTKLPSRIRQKFSWLKYSPIPHVVVDPPNHILNVGRCLICGVKTEDVVRGEHFDLDGQGGVCVDFLGCKDHQIDEITLRKAHESLLASGICRRLPHWLCYGHFRSFADGGRMDLIICWFAESVDVHFRDLIGDNIRAVDWNCNAQFTSFDDY